MYSGYSAQPSSVLTIFSCCYYVGGSIFKRASYSILINSFRRRRLQHVIGLLVLTSLCLLMYLYWRYFPDMVYVESRVSDGHYVKQLLERADANVAILLALVDVSFLDLALNFYLTSIQPHHIDNYLFVGVSRRACDYLRSRHIACYTYTEDVDSDVESAFNSASFLRKTNLRTEMILDALLAGVTVIHTDVDVIFLKNPIPEMLATDGRNDVAVLWDYSTVNAGFLLVRPNKRSVWIYDQVRAVTERWPRTNDQLALHYVLGRCSTFGYCSMEILNQTRFLNGKAYFEDGQRMFFKDNPCSDCVVVHNNYIVSKAAKVYRFKENQMWFVDQNGYYSSADVNYLTFDIHDEVHTIEQQSRALANALALGQILNRTVILPKFKCANHVGECAMNSLFKMSQFDSEFSTRYRESTFLMHPMVPHDVISSTKLITLRNLYSLTSDSIRRLFGGVHSRILRFTDSLHDLSVTFTNKTEGQMFWRKVQNAIVKCDYRQFC